MVGKKRSAKNRTKGTAWVVAADMGYGHQRAAYPLKDIAYERIINANSDKIIANDEKRTWNKAKIFYEWISRTSELPIIGRLLFGIYNQIQKISPYYPLRNNSSSTFAVRYLDRAIRKGLCKSLINYIRDKDIPLITSFYIPAIAADYYKFPKIYCVITDTDINRIWVPANPSLCNIKYLVPCTHAQKRLLTYGIKKENIFLTGFPLPKENIGGVDSRITCKVLSQRLINLDPKKIFIGQYGRLISKILGKSFDISSTPVPVTITFMIGGAGANKDIAIALLSSLKEKLLHDQIRLCLVAGTHLDIRNIFEEEILRQGLTSAMGRSLSIICKLTKKEYFESLNAQLNVTDILWTKPSELSFYTALGLPIIISAPLGAQEIWNRKWLFEIGAGLEHEDPYYAAQWIDEWLSDGRLAMRAWNGFMNAPRLGTYNIEKIVFGDLSFSIR
jgi:hypothetical protein